jgi:ABC-type transporter MlaC component
MAEATLKEVRDFFEMNNTDFTKDWKRLTPEDRDYFKKAVGEEIHKD